MASARLLSQQRRVRDEERRLYHVLLLGRSVRESRRDLGKLGVAKPQPLSAPIDSAVVPHHLSDGVSGYQCRASVAQRWNVPVFLARKGRQLLRVDHVARNALGKDQSFQQRV